MNKIRPLRIGNIYGPNCGTGFAGNIWNKDFVSPTIMTMQGGATRAYDFNLL